MIVEDSKIPTHKTSGTAGVIKTVLILAVAVVAVGALVTRGIHARTQAASEVRQRTLELAIPLVSVVRPKPGAMQNELVLPGNIQAFTEAPVYARASGYLKKWYADIGTHVKAGQVLADIEAPELDQQVKQAKAAIDQTQAALEQALANREQGKANSDLARITADRTKQLNADGIVSRQENDQSQAQLSAQLASVQALDKAIAAARSNIAASEANMARLQELQNYKTVRAPFEGVITARNTDVGALVNEGSGGAAQELFHIAATNQLRVFVSVPQSYSRSITPGLPAQLTLAEFPNRRFAGKIARTTESIDPMTRTLLTEVDIDNTSGQLRPGAYAEVHLTLAQSARALIVPVNVLMFRSEGLRIGVLRDGSKVDLVPAVIGKDYGTELEIVSGISENDQLIANPPDSLTTGTVVKVIGQDDTK